MHRHLYSMAFGRRAAKSSAPALGVAFLAGLALSITPGTTYAQSSTESSRFAGFYFGASIGNNSAIHSAGGYTSLVRQISGINIPGLGIVNVPSTTVNVPATHTGGSLDTTFPTCTTTVLPSSIKCTGNASFGTLTSLSHDPISNSGGRATEYAVGAHAGYNVLFNKFVFGGEVEFSRSTVRGRSQVLQIFPATALTNCVFGSDTVPPPNPCSPSIAVFTRDAETNWTSSQMGRAGTIWKKVLLYGVAGPAIAHVKAQSTDTLFNTLSNGADCPCPPNSGSAQRVTGLVTTNSVFTPNQTSQIARGWTAGGGVERPVGDHWGIGVEYRHMSIGNKDFPETSLLVTLTTGTTGEVLDIGGIVSPPAKLHYMDDRITLRINFHP